MAWTYADYESQATNTLRLTRLRLHIDEVEAAISADVSGAEFSRSAATLERKLDRLHRRRDELERKTSRAATGIVGRLAHKQDRT